MRRRPLNLLITALLMFQLAIGMQWQSAHAEVGPVGQGMNSPHEEHCSSHQLSADGAGKIRGEQTGGRFSPHGTFGKHDCCHSAGCQCNFAQQLATLSLLIAGPQPASVLLPTVNSRTPAMRST